MNTRYDRYIKIISKSLHQRNKLLKAKAKDLGLSEGEAVALMFFYKHSGMDNAADMVKECQVSKAFVSKIMISLLAKKMITIEQDKKDKRARNITLTHQARQKAKILINAMVEHLDQMFEGLTPSQIEELDRIFDIFQQNTDKRKDVQL